MTTAARPRTLRVLLAAGLASVLAITSLGTVDASSHREAPLITEDPVADNTDTYAFVSPANPDNTVLVANYIPLQAPNGGPNFHNFGEDVLYAVNVDNDGDAVADVTFEFDFRTELTNPDTTLYANGQITSLTGEGAAAWNLRQYYDLSVVRDGVRTVLGQDLIVPPNNIGPRTTPDYAALSDAAIATLPVDGGDLQVFAGQKDDPFWVDLGSIFDLGALRPFEGAHLIDQPQTDPVDAVAGKNVHALVIEVPSSYLTQSAEQPVIGVWATASRRQTRTFAGGSSATPIHTGPFRQVSRLGMPLVNEVVIPTGLKDAFNTLSPDQDAATLAGLQTSVSTVGDIPIVTDPELAQLIPFLYPGAYNASSSFSVPAAPRDDLVGVFLTGVPGLNQFSEGFVPAEMLRLNTSIAPSSSDPNAVNRLGVLAEDNTLTGELDGFPNGRRLADDVTDIALRVTAGALVDAAATPPLTDGTLANDLPFLSSFPYLAQPHSGYHTPQSTTTDNNL
ncbi:MAG TPA: DUF4331 domain-containing protein [Euzebya sp.]|nr:DUF4331 domain-containing protein [Euzebya sp.]